MSFVGWIIAVALGYMVVGRMLFLVADALRTRQMGSVLSLAAGLGLGAVLALLFASVLGITFDKSPGSRQFLILIHPWFEVAVAGGLLLGFVLAGVATRSRMSWKDQKRRNELSKQIKLHLALVTGALVFSVPFYWLITTSLKPDDRTNMFPPDLIPRQQQRVTIGGEPRKIYILDQGDTNSKVAKMGELENDQWQVQAVTDDEIEKTMAAGISRAGISTYETPKRKPFSVASAKLEPDLHTAFLWRNYSEALEFLPPEYNRGLAPLWNTVYVTLLTIVGTILSSSLVAFAFARLRWPGRDLLFVVLLATMMIPPAVTMLPVFLIFRSLNWIDTLKPLWVPALFGSAFNVFLLRQFFMTIPNDLEDAAKIDGCSYFTIYWRIMLPLIKPALAALTIFAFMGSWNNFMGPLIYISSPEKMTLAYALQLFQGSHGGEPAMMMAAATLVMLPVLIVFFFTQRYMIQGVTLTGIKG